MKGDVVFNLETENVEKEKPKLEGIAEGDEEGDLWTQLYAEKLRIEARFKQDSNSREWLDLG